MKSYGFALVAVFFWSFNVIIARYLADNLTPVETSFGRWFFAMVCILPFSIKPVIKDWNIIKKHLPLILVIGGVGVALLNTLVYKAGETASAVNMSIIGTIGPIFLVIFARIILKTAISKKQVIGLGLALLGVLIIITGGKLETLKSFSFVSGDFWMLSMTVVFGFYGVMQTFKPKELSQVTFLSVTTVVAIIILLPFLLWDIATKPLPDMTFDVWAVLIYMGVLPSLLSFLCWNEAIARLGAMKTSMIYYLMPIFSTIEAYFILGEKISFAQISGGIIVLLGVFITELHQKPKFHPMRA